MAKKKPRTPMPPRNASAGRQVQAPARRDTRSGSNPLSGIPRWALAAGGVVLVGAIVAIVLLASGGSSGGSGNGDVKAAMLAAGCTYRDVPPKPPKVEPTNYHADVPTLSTSTKGLWSTSPPSGGGHYATWAVWGFYTDPVNPRQVVHNEEHGAVVIWWGPKVSSATVDKLHSFYDEKPNGMFGTPYAALGDKIALTAWTGDPKNYYVNHDYGMGHIAVCPGYDEKAFTTFRNAYVGKGPEGIPLSSDAPGMGPQ